MAYNEHLAERIQHLLKRKKIPFEEKKMMGGLCFLVDDKMCVGIVKNEMMCRIHPDIYEESLNKSGVKEMTYTGRPMKGYIFVEPKVIEDDWQLEHWIQLCLDFNPVATSSKKKKK